jgi:catechol 2,3-dioxygenase-like lactoylglutathione lyase family enzyme
MPIERVEAVTYGVEDVAAGTRYFEDLGLEIVERGARGAMLRTRENQIFEIRESTDKSLPPTDVSGSTMREAVWGVDSEAELDALATALARDRDVRVDSSGAAHALDDSGFAIAFRVSAPTPIHSEPILANVSGASPRVNKPLRLYERAHPIRILHVGYFIPKPGHEAASDFYLERLRFRLTDRIVTDGDFMRCARSQDHHNLLLLHRGNTRSFGHVAVEVRDLDEIIAGGQFMKSKGWVAGKTPGRHILGSNLNWFFRNPCGGNVEYTADFDRVDDNWVPRIFEKHPGVAAWHFDPD